VRGRSQSLEIVSIAPAQPVVSARSNRKARTSDSATRSHRSADNPLSRPEITPPNDASNAIQPPVDWVGELSRAATDAASKQSAQKPKDFGFPHSPAAATAKPPQFGWDYASTHRLESLPGGGLLVRLNDNCVLVLLPLPFAGCAIGKRKAKGDLFEHMSDPSPLGDLSETK
jgi:hypothetical protein